MDMVEVMLLLSQAVRSSDWKLSLEALHNFRKYFFDMDRQNYARMIALYLSDLANLEKTNPLIYEEFLFGNWVVNKSNVFFSALGADKALEQENRRLKVLGGLTGITQSEAARAKFFLADVELNRISSKVEKFACKKDINKTPHHSLSMTQRKRQDRNISQLATSFEPLFMLKSKFNPNCFSTNFVARYSA